MPLRLGAAGAMGAIRRGVANRKALSFNGRNIKLSGMQANAQVDATKFATPAPPSQNCCSLADSCAIASCC